MKKGIMQKKNTIYSAIGKAVIIALIVSAAGAFAGALMQSKEILSEESSGLLSFAVWVIAAFAGAISSTRFAGSESILPALLTNLMYAVILAGIGILFFESNFRNILGALLALLAGMVPAIFIIINHIPGKNKRIRYKA